MSGIDSKAVWEFLWPILKEGLIALLMALLALLGYDKFVPSRYVRSEALHSAQDKALHSAQDKALHSAQDKALHSAQDKGHDDG